MARKKTGEAAREPAPRTKVEKFGVEFDAATGRKASTIIAVLGYSSRAEWIRQVVRQAIKDVWPQVQERIAQTSADED